MYHNILLSAKEYADIAHGPKCFITLLLDKYYSEGDILNLINRDTRRYCHAAIIFADESTRGLKKSFATFGIRKYPYD